GFSGNPGFIGDVHAGCRESIGVVGGAGDCDVAIADRFDQCIANEYGVVIGTVTGTVDADIGIVRGHTAAAADADAIVEVCGVVAASTGDGNVGRAGSAG